MLLGTSAARVDSTHGIVQQVCSGEPKQRTTPAGQTRTRCSTCSGCFSAYCAARYPVTGQARRWGAGQRAGAGYAATMQAGQRGAASLARAATCSRKKDAVIQWLRPNRCA